MVATVTDYTEVKNRALIGSGFDGVVRVLVNGYFGTGTLLFGGQAVLTAAHLFSKQQGLVSTNIAQNLASVTDITFESTLGVQIIAASHVQMISANHT